MFNHWCYIIRQLLTNPSWLTLIWGLPLVPVKNNADFKSNSSIKLLIGITSGWYCYTWAEWTTQWIGNNFWQLGNSMTMAASLMPARSLTARWYQVTIFGQIDSSWQQVTMVILNIHIAWCFRVLCALGNVCIRCWKIWEVFFELPSRGGICHCRHCRRQCKIFVSGVNFSISLIFLCFYHQSCWNSVKLRV